MKSGVDENKLIFVRTTTTMTKVGNYHQRNENYDENWQHRLKLKLKFMNFIRLDRKL